MTQRGEISTVRPPGRRRDADDTRRRLIQAATQLFSKMGYEATTTKLIAKRAGVNEALIQRYFDSKAGLLLAVYRELNAESDFETREHERGATLEEDLVNFLKLRVELTRDKEREIRLIVSRAIVDPTLAMEIAQRVCRGGMPSLAKRLEELQAEGKVRGDIDLDPLGHVVSSIAFMLAFFTQLVFQQPAELVDSAIRVCARVLADGLKPQS
jgi:AcrR family transcriptional regulator